MYRSFILSVLVIICIQNVISEEIYKIVETKSGPIRGKFAKTLFDEKPYFSFKGVPYAEPPVNKLRFKPPMEKKPWTDVLDAFDFGNVCPQNVYLFGEGTIGDEDCLFLNIYTSDVSSEKKRSVMVYLHGGAFVEGSGNDIFYGPDFLLNEDVILVTMNYRIGVLGFMSLGTPEYSGNMGLKDQNLALKWIKENIEYFGGDRNKITLFGHSAGAACVHYHILSPESNTLFQRGILMSGSASNFWAEYVPGEHMLHMFMYLKAVGKNIHNDKDLISFVQNVDAKFFLESFSTYVSIVGERKELEILWAPVVEKKHAKKPIIQMKAEDLLDNTLNNKIDLMFGHTANEFLFLIAEEIHNPELLKPFDEKFEIQMTRNKMDTHYEAEEYKELTKQVRNVYFGENLRVTNETYVKYVDLLSDVFMVYGIDKSIKKHVRNSEAKTYYYRFSVEGKLNMFKKMFDMEALSGTSHGDELCYLFRCAIVNEIYENITDDSVEMKTIRATSKVWANFAKFGNPLPNNDPIEVKPVEKDVLNFVDITNHGLVPALGPHNKYLSFWDNIYEKYDIFLQDLKAKDEL